MNSHSGLIRIKMYDIKDIFGPWKKFLFFLFFSCAQEAPRSWRVASLKSQTSPVWIFQTTVSVFYLFVLFISAGPALPFYLSTAHFSSSGASLRFGYGSYHSSSLACQEPLHQTPFTGQKLQQYQIQVGEQNTLFLNNPVCCHQNTADLWIKS